LGEPVIGYVPSDYQTTVNSINLGTPLVQSDPNSKIALEIRRIAGQIATGGSFIEPAKQRRPFWSSFLKRESPEANFELPSLEKV
jgi:MinD-like ATPase involved in chromosome partitioning or flagellar assembly